MTSPADDIETAIRRLIRQELAAPPPAVINPRDAALLAMLKKLQWSARKGNGDARCPICHGLATVGHTNDCEMAALLRGLEGDT